MKNPNRKPIYETSFVETEHARRMALESYGMYDSAQEKSACGVGMVVSIDGKKTRTIVENGIEALKSVWHRGAVDADGKTGDGAGIHLQIPVNFFREQIRLIGSIPKNDELIAVGQVFLPRMNAPALEESLRIIESEILRMGYTIYGWRHVPIDILCLGERAQATRPEIRQILISNASKHDETVFERTLYIIRRRIEKAALKAQIPGLYICSLSCRSIIYKGMMLAEQVSHFYPDLNDPLFESAFAIYHQRYSTNTFPQWWLAQPFRALAHNGEINTLKGNINWMKSHEIRMASGFLGNLAKDIKPVIPHNASDSAALDAVFELMVRAGRSAPMVKTMLIPETWSNIAVDLPETWKDMYAYCNAVMEPWDGPAAVVMTDGNWVGAGMDRNGLRPLRYVLTNDGILIAGSETGMISIKESRVKEKGALGPGQMIFANIQEGKLYHDNEIKDKLAEARPYKKWVSAIKDLEDITENNAEQIKYKGKELRQRQAAAGYSLEEIEHILSPMGEDGKESIASMGDDTPLAVLSTKYRPLSHFFKQNFSQVTNPPIDSLREYRVMSLKTRFGNLKNVLDEDRNQTEIYLLPSPIVTNAEFEAMIDEFDADNVHIDCRFKKGESLRSAIEKVRIQAEDAVASGKSSITLSDENQDANHIGLPMILVTSAVHSWLTKKGLRTFCSLNVRSAECIDSHYFALLIGCGATTVNAYLAQDTLAERVERGLIKISLNEAVERYKNAINQGILKIMSKMGIAVISSYRGGLNFEAVGLSRAMVAEFFPGMPSKISGLGLVGIQKMLEKLHLNAWKNDNDSLNILPVGGFYKARHSGEKHAWRSDNMHILQTACTRGDYKLWQHYSRLMDNPSSPIHLRDLLTFKALGKPINIDDVESVTALRKRFVTPGMSLGALSPEAHRTLNIAMNRIGSKSDSGEGGEDPANFYAKENGDNASAKIKQVASGRFGVTAEYLNHCEEIEIKIAQGAKPGEGGQLPGIKVTDLIARLRHSTKGVTLISPPPHHDIYSIEDLSQLIYDLKQINPRAKVTVKLVAASGVGTIAAGVAKAKADIILISAHNGGTGASPATSIKHIGLPWEMGLSEAHQVLALNSLRSDITLRTDGGLRTGRDIVIAAMMGAEEYGIGTAALIAMGCIMVRQCQSNTCPVGVCTQDERLREKFTGNPEKVINLITFYAEHVREILASLGARCLDDVIGRSDLLLQTSRGGNLLDDLDLSSMLITVDDAPKTILNRNRSRKEIPESLDSDIIRDAETFLKNGEKTELSYSVRNTNRSVGTRVSSHIVQKFKNKEALREGQLTVLLRGSAGQSLGAFGTWGLKIKLVGDANDFVGKGLSGATISIAPKQESTFTAADNMIAGNTILYGATSGKLFISGRAGERFCVRNSGAQTVSEGCGSNGCEYMTGGVSVILGMIGSNFGAGMTGGMAYIYDPTGTNRPLLNMETLIACGVVHPYWERQLKTLINQHFAETHSILGQEILADWQKKREDFIQICPKEMLAHLPHPLSTEQGKASA